MRDGKSQSFESIRSCAQYSAGTKSCSWKAKCGPVFVMDLPAAGTALMQFVLVRMQVK